MSACLFPAWKMMRSRWGLDGVRTPSNKAKKRPVCGRAMKKNGRTGKGTQRWRCRAHLRRSGGDGATSARDEATPPAGARGRSARAATGLVSRLPPHAGRKRW
ncbi:hypothetical protein F8277_11645 [Bifidobacterium longum subsp. infantis]|nr:hypothetical protein F8277_11645 [Bifidobacterium longum subsp. infantis]